MDSHNCYSQPGQLSNFPSNIILDPAGDVLITFDDIEDQNPTILLASTVLVQHSQVFRDALDGEVLFYQRVGPRRHSEVHPIIVPLPHDDPQSMITLFALFYDLQTLIPLGLRKSVHELANLAIVCLKYSCCFSEPVQRYSSNCLLQLSQSDAKVEDLAVLAYNFRNEEVLEEVSKDAIMSSIAPVDCVKLRAWKAMYGISIPLSFEGKVVSHRRPALSHRSLTTCAQPSSKTTASISVPASTPS